MSSQPLLIDASFIGHRARFALGDLSSEDKRTGVIFGFLDQIRKIGVDNTTNKLIFCWDSRESLRKKISPEYKNKRHKNLTEEEQIELKLAYQQFDLLRTEVLPEIGFTNQFIQEGYEADDVIASLVKKHSKEYLIVSSDQDLFQLLDDANMYNVITKKTMTAKRFYEVYGIVPEQWPWIKATSGCKSDNVVGISGVGEKTAIKFLNNQLKSHVQSFKKIMEQKDEMLEQNMPLVKLPFRGTKIFKVHPDNLSFERFTRVCHKYEFMSFLNGNDNDNWRVFLNFRG